MTGRARTALVASAATAGAVALVVGVAIQTAPVRGSVRTYTELLAAANRQDVVSARRLCTVRYARTHTLRPAPDGGLVNLPRNIHENFRAWRAGPHVWLCPNREGPVFQFVREGGSWRFDGPVGILRGRGPVLRYEEGETPGTEDSPSR